MFKSLKRRIARSLKTKVCATSQEYYDIVIIGSGFGGGTLAARLAEAKESNPQLQATKIIVLEQIGRAHV